MKKVLIITDEKKSSYNQCDALLYYLNKKVKLKTKYLKIERELIHILPNFLIYIYLLVKLSLKKKKIIFQILLFLVEELVLLTV